MITHSPTQTKAIGLTHLYLAPSVHGPGLERVAHPPAQEHRDRVGDVEADHRDRRDREERDRDARLVREVGRDRDDQGGQQHEQDRPRRRPVRAQPPPQAVAGDAPSRENANVIREALVTQAMPQKSWPIVEIRSTALAAAELSAVSRIATAGKPGRC